MAEIVFLNLKVPKESEIHLDAPNGHGFVIAWEKVDPLLKACSHVGDLSWLARLVMIPHGTLSNRRKELGLPPLPVGRPRETVLTDYEALVLEKRDAGVPLKILAADRGVSHVSILKAEGRARDKIRRQCPKCRGVGNIPCGLPNGDERDELGAFSTKCCSSTHTCEGCGGTGNA